MGEIEQGLKQSVLIIDDEPGILDLLEQFIATKGLRVETASTAEDAIHRLKQNRYDAIITDLNLPGLDGAEVVRQAISIDPKTVIFVITGAASIQTAVRCIRLGACDFIPKPFDLMELGRKLVNALADNRAEGSNNQLDRLEGKKTVEAKIIGQSHVMRDLYELIAIVARSNSTILITGETGTGKELIAQSIHQLSPRSRGQMVALNCAAIPENLLEDELFGHVKGAFTGAQTNRVGRFEQAHGGTLFLDEIGYMSPSLQVKLLRVLQEREFERLGASQPVKVDVRVIAATSANLERMINDGTFRRDLYYRLNVIPIQSPALRHRPDDIALLADYFIAKFCSELSVPRKRLSPETTGYLITYDWPGNVRELQNMVERAVVLSQRRDQLIPSDFAFAGRTFAAAESEPVRSINIPSNGLSFDSEVSNLERELILQSLQRTNGNKARAADLLGINRTTLNAKIKRLNLATDEWVETGS